MVANRTIARPYAKAAFEYAIAQNDIQNWASFLELMAAVSTQPQVITILHNPKISTQQSLDFFIDLAGKDLDQHKKNFLSTMSLYHRLTDLPAVAELFDEFVKEQAKTMTVDIISATPLTSKQKERMITALNIRLQRDVNPNYLIDPALIGGAIIRAGDFVIDGSVRAKLERLKQAIEA